MKHKEKFVFEKNLRILKHKMGRLREKILPSLRAALEKLEENAETIPHEDSPNYLPRWDFSQSQAGCRILSGS